MESIRLNSLFRQPVIDSVDIVSISPSLYTMRVHIGNTEYRVLDHGASIRRASVEALKNLLLGCNVNEFRITHQSAYDEMIGQPGGGKRGNRLTVTIAPPNSD